MNRDDIVRLAVKCQLVTTGNRDGFYMEALERFAALVAAQEREACAKVCGELHLEGEDDTGLAADMIRARGETK